MVQENYDFRELIPAVERGETSLERAISNCDRAVGAALSGWLVAEGVGDHGCEYMTGGVAVVLGPVGVNFAAGMTGGVAYVYDESATLDLNCNLDSVDLFPVEEGSADEKSLLALVEEHVARTGSPKAARILASWPDARHCFSKVLPC